MKTVVVSIPEKMEAYFMDLFKKHRVKLHVLPDREDEAVLAEWIDEGMKSEDVPEEEIFEIFRKHGIKG